MKHMLVWLGGITLLAIFVLTLSSENMPTTSPATAPTTTLQVKQPDFDKNSPITQEADLTTFANAIRTAQLVDLFRGTGPFTAFAPSNDAFKKLGDKKLATLFQPAQRDSLTNILIYHIVPGKYPSANLKNMTLKTIQGKPLEIRMGNNGEIRVNNAKVVKKDLMGPNGVLYIIDTVLIP